MEIEIVQLDGYKGSLTDFDCGAAHLDKFLFEQARDESMLGLSKTILAILKSGECVGFVSICACSFQKTKMQDEDSAGMGYSKIPGLLVGRLAVSTKYQRAGVGQALMKYTIRTALEISTRVGISVIAVDPKDDAAKGYYLKYGFIVLGNSRAMYLPMRTFERGV